MISLERLNTLLGGCRIGSCAKVYETVGSTNTVLAEWAAAGAPHGSAVIARTQSAGKGRLGRIWHSPPGLNLYTSVCLRGDFETSILPFFVYLAGVAVAEAVSEQAGFEPFLKWPNDLHHHGRKIGGILCESISVQNQPPVILGIGLNVNATEEDFHSELRSLAGSLRIAVGKTFDRTAVLAAIYLAIDRNYTIFLRNPENVVSTWKRLAGVPGIRYTIRTGENMVQGNAVDLGTDGALVIVDGSGAENRVYCGDVISYERDGENAFRH